MSVPTESRPYLSLIATSRNDDHGGSMLHRMQAFIEGICGQCHKFQLDWELILVEWNPPADRPPLAQALAWPKEKGPLQIKIVQVPPGLHQSLDHAEKMGLFQMIAKNVGARRARGDFLLFTNIDILFNDALVQFLAERPLRKGQLYRIDRNDVRNEVPVGAGVDALLQWASVHQIRRHRKDGSYRVKPNGEILWGSVIHPDFEVVFGFMAMLEQGREAVYMKSCARLSLRKEMSHVLLALGLAEEIAELGQLVLEVRTEEGELVQSAAIAGLPHNGELAKESPGSPWQTLHIARHFEKGTVLCFEIRQGSLPPESMTWNCLRVGLVSNQNECRHDQGGPFAVFGEGWHQWERDAGQQFFRWAADRARLAVGGRQSVLRMQISPGPSLGGVPARLQIVQAGQIIDTYSLDCTRDIYLDCRQHGTASEIALVELQMDRQLAPFADDPKKRVLGFQATDLRLQRPGLLSSLFSAWNRLWFDGVRPWAKRLLSKTVPRAAVLQTQEATTTMSRRQVMPANVDIGALNGALGFAAGNSPAQDQAEWGKVWHTNGCGDFTLASREEFIQLGGYWEFHGFSMHIDSLFLYAAQHAGMEEVVLEEPMAIYHIEHQPGSGYTPEAADQMYERVKKKKLPFVADDEVYVHRSRIFAGQGLPNPPNWGFAGESLPQFDIK